jgi:hypothetical protein
MVLGLLWRVAEAESTRESSFKIARVWLAPIFEYPKMSRSGDSEVG